MKFSSSIFYAAAGFALSSGNSAAVAVAAAEVQKDGKQEQKQSNTILQEDGAYWSRILEDSFSFSVLPPSTAPSDVPSSGPTAAPTPGPTPDPTPGPTPGPSPGPTGIACQVDVSTLLVIAIEVAECNTLLAKSDSYDELY